jgi:hypothetical protein
LEQRLGLLEVHGVKALGEPAETLRGGRIAKEKAAKKSDAIVALAIACVAAIEGKPKTFDRSAREAIVQLNEVLARSSPWLIDDDDESL